MRVLVFGDSITQGFWDTEGGWVERLRKHFDSIALQDLNRGPITEVFNLGISGDTTRNLLARIEAETQARKPSSEPLIVAIAIGTNDDLFESDKQWVPPEEFRGNLEKIMDILQPLTDRIILIGNPACDESRTTPVSWGVFTYTNRELEQSEQIIGEVAKAHDLTYIPIFHEFKRRLDEDEGLLEGGLHPNNAGHQIMYEIIKPKLLELLI
jgi:lysophospholipase L1-like esterase